MISISPQAINESIFDEISQTEKSIEEFKEMPKPVASDVAIERESRMDKINYQSVAKDGLKQAQIKLMKLHSVFSQLDHTDFGICIKCHQPIPLERTLIRLQSLLFIH